MSLVKTYLSVYNFKNFDVANGSCVVRKITHFKITEWLTSELKSSVQVKKIGWKIYFEQ